MKKFSGNNSLGMSLIEVMIVMTIMSLIGLGTATLMKNMFAIQRRNNLKVVASEIKLNLEKVLKNDTAWGFTVNAGANAGTLNCLKDNIGNCNHGAAIGAFNVMNIDNTPYYQSIQATRGFAADGTSNCNAFVNKPAAGSDACPFRYNLRATFTCQGNPAPATCNKPQVRIEGDFIYNPNDLSDPRNRINEADYKIDFIRGARERYEPLQVVYMPTTNAVTGCTNTNTWEPRPLTGETYDAGNNVTVAGNSFTLVPGTYDCKIIAQAYEAIEGFSLQLYSTTKPPIPVGGGYSNLGTTAYSTSAVQLQLTSPTTFQLRHMCIDNPAGPPSSMRGNFDMGIPLETLGTYLNGTLLTSITCVRTS